MARDIKYTLNLSTGPQEVAIHITDEMEPFILKEGESFLAVDPNVSLPSIPDFGPCTCKPMTAEEWAEALS